MKKYPNKKKTPQFTSIKQISLSPNKLITVFYSKLRINLLENLTSSQTDVGTRWILNFPSTFWMSWVFYSKKKKKKYPDLQYFISFLFYTSELAQTKLSVYFQECVVAVCLRSRWKKHCSQCQNKSKRSQHISGCKCHVAAKWWMSRAFDVWERSEHNSQSAVTPYQTLMIQSIHTGSGRFAHIYQGGGGVVWKLLWKHYLCSVFSPPNQKRRREGGTGACHHLSEGFISPWSVLEAMKTGLWRLGAPLRLH